MSRSVVRVMTPTGHIVLILATVQKLTLYAHVFSYPAAV